MLLIRGEGHLSVVAFFTGSKATSCILRLVIHSGEGNLDFDLFLRAFVACYFVFVALHYTARLAGLRARTGVPHASMGPTGSANRSNQVIFRFFRALILILMLARVATPTVDTWLGAIRPLENALLGFTGLVLMAVGLFVVDYGHSYLNDDWKSGIGLGAGRQLITTGPYEHSRNPIFTGVILGQIGLFLAAPSIFTLACAAIGIAVILRQVRGEEAALAATFGAEYAVYSARVPRWYRVGGFFGALVTR